MASDGTAAAVVPATAKNLLDKAQIGRVKKPTIRPVFFIPFIMTPTFEQWFQPMDRREEIYEKALELFIAEGYDNTPLSKIAETLNLTKAGLYHYFSSKEELLFAVHCYTEQKRFRPILDIAEKIEDPEERIKFFLRNYVVKVLTVDPSIRVAIHEIKKLNPPHQRKISDSWKRALNLIRDALTELESDGRIKKINKTFAAFAALGMCSWTFYWFDYERSASAEELADTYIEIFLRGIFN